MFANELNSKFDLLVSTLFFRCPLGILISCSNEVLIYLNPKNMAKPYALCTVRPMTLLLQVKILTEKSTKSDSLLLVQNEYTERL